MTGTLDVQCVVVHHRSPATLPAAVASMVGAGVAPERIVVVDNSPEPEPDVDPLTAGVRVFRVPNQGYAAAANYGLDVLAHDPAPFTLLATHEVILAPDAVATLVGAVRTDPRIALAGPTLVDADTGRPWSQGGLLTKWLHLPTHRRLDGLVRGLPSLPVDWLDGACTLSPTPLLQEYRFDERYFMYFEDTDLGLRFREAGWRVVWVPDAVAHQRSSGIPAFLIGRNLFLFEARHFSRWTGRAAVANMAARRGVRKLVTGRGSWGDPVQIVRGWWQAERLTAAGRATAGGRER